MATTAPPTTTNPDRTVGPLATELVRDLPAGGTRMVKRARGVPWVLVNGAVVVDQGRMNAAGGGQVLTPA